MKKNLIRYLAGFIYSGLIIFNFPAYSHDILTGIERHTKDTWKVSCKDYAKTNNHHIYTADATIEALAHHWHLPEAEFEEKFLRDAAGDYLYKRGANIFPSSENPTAGEFTCKDRRSTDETLEVKTKLISYWKVSCTPRTLMSETKNADHLISLLMNTVGDPGPDDKKRWDMYVKELFTYNYKTKTGFVCPESDAIRLILWTHGSKSAGQPSDTSTIITDSASQINCAAIPDAELTTIGNQAQCPDEIALREHQRNNNEAKEKASIDKEIENP